MKNGKFENLNGMGLAGQPPTPPSLTQHVDAENDHDIGWLAGWLAVNAMPEVRK